MYHTPSVNNTKWQKGPPPPFSVFKRKPKGQLIIAMFHGWGGWIFNKAPRDWLNLAIRTCFQSLFGNLPSIIYIQANPCCPFSHNNQVSKYRDCQVLRKANTDSIMQHFPFNVSGICIKEVPYLWDPFHPYCSTIWGNETLFFLLRFRQFSPYTPQNASWLLFLMNVNTVPAVICASLSVPSVFYGAPPVHPSMPKTQQIPYN